MTYVPRTLPPLPRRKCPFECHKTVGSKQDLYVVPTPCTGKVRQSGWCAEHEHCQEFLEIGARLGYPPVLLSIGLSVGASQANWEAYAVRYPRKKREQVMAVLRELLKEQEQAAWPA